MYKILKKRVLNEQVTEMVIDAPYVAKKALPGQFIIFRIDENGERTPLTIADYDREKGTITIIYQIVGKTTRQLGDMNEGEELLDFVGPLGTPSHLEGLKKVAVIGGGLGTAIAYPQAKMLHENGADVDLIVGFRNKDLVLLEGELGKACTRFFITTDDGSYKEHGFVTDVLKRLIEEGNQYEEIIAIGPLVMMRAVCNLTKPFHIKTMISMNPIMIDGTGMCGVCRVSVGGKMKFACVDGPDFDGHLVDFDEAIRRSRMFKKQETEAMESHVCNLTGEVRANG